MGYSLCIEGNDTHNGEGFCDEQKDEIWLWPPPQKKPFLPSLTCVHTQGSFCGFDCNPICTLADLEFGLAQTLLIRIMVCKLFWL